MATVITGPIRNGASVEEDPRIWQSMYACSSAELNPISVVPKQDLRRMLLWAFVRERLLAAGVPQTAELRVFLISRWHRCNRRGQSVWQWRDGNGLRQFSRCGSVSLLVSLIFLFILFHLKRNHKLFDSSVYHGFPKLIVCVESFCGQGKAIPFLLSLFYYSVNRHKLCTKAITPAYNAEACSPDDHRFERPPTDTTYMLASAFCIEWLFGERVRFWFPHCGTAWSSRERRNVLFIMWRFPLFSHLVFIIYRMVVSPVLPDALSISWPFPFVECSLVVMSLSPLGLSPVLPILPHWCRLVLECRLRVVAFLA